MSADDLRKLKNDDIEKIRMQGDDYLKKITREQEHQRAMDRER